MAKVVKTIGVIAGSIALVATGVGAVAGAGLLVGGIGTVGSIATVASVVSSVAGVAAQALAKTPKAPDAFAQGSVSQILIRTDAPQPYVMGEGYYAGVLRHDAGYGGTVDGVQNPYRGLVIVYSGGGPVQSIAPRVDFQTVPTWYNTFLFTDVQLGATPEATALTPNYPGMTGWGATYKLSGQAATLWNLRFDKEGKRFSGGVPPLGMEGQWVKVYDPRLDGTRPGGVGAHRLNDESTWAYSANPALHAATYAYGRHQNGKRTIGIGLPDEGIDWATVSAWANVCDANDWDIFGVVYEPGDRWENLRNICAAGGAEPMFSGAVMSFRFSAPVVALDTVTEDDIADEDMRVTAMQSYRDRLNSVVPKYRSPDHNWEMVSALPITVAEYVTEDGEERREEWTFAYVKKPKQAGQLASYRLVDSREFRPIELTCMPRMRAYRPGECLHLDLPQLGLDMDAIILTREVDPATMKVRFTLISETPGKHAFALGETAVPPDPPSLGQTAEERDESAVSSIIPAQTLMTSIRAAGPINPRDPSNAPKKLLFSSAPPVGSVGVSVARHDWDYPDDGLAPIMREASGNITTLSDGVTPIPDGTRVFVYFDDPTLSETNVTYFVTLDEEEATNSNSFPARHPVGTIETPIAGDPDKEADRSVGYGFYV